MLVGTQKALTIAIKNMGARRRVTMLKVRLQTADGTADTLGVRERMNEGPTK